MRSGATLLLLNEDTPGSLQGGSISIKLFWPKISTMASSIGLRVVKNVFLQSAQVGDQRWVAQGYVVIVDQYVCVGVYFSSKKTEKTFPIIDL